MRKLALITLALAASVTVPAAALIPVHKMTVTRKPGTRITGTGRRVPARTAYDAWRASLGGAAAKAAAKNGMTPAIAVVA